MSAVPVLDLQAFTAGDSASRAQFVEDLRDAAHRVGFFYLKGYGASESQSKAVLQAARVFFGLSDAQKQSLHMANSPHFRGYTAAGDEITRGERDWREQLDVGAERPPLGDVATLQPAWARLQGPNQWPAPLPAFKPLILDWQNTLTLAAQQLLQALALALGQSVHYFNAPFAETPVQHLKIIRYPGRTADQSDQGVGAHKDSGCLTLLLQDTQAGLQVLEREGPGEARWIDVPPLEGTVVINLGEVLEILTQGYLRATTHRVVSPRTGNSRLSVAFFLSPRLDAELQQVPLPPALAARARGVDTDPRNPLIPHTGSNLLKGRLRSHPEVARRFYADLAPH
jgi:isopenicillin N synthase-like dioxygenase